MNMAVLGVGTAVPACSLSQVRAAEMMSGVSGYDAERSEWLAYLYESTGIKTRHISVLDEGEIVPAAILESEQGPTTRWRMERYNEKIAPLARRASNAALTASNVAPEAITHLVTVSCTGFAAPGFDLHLIEALPLDPSVQRTHVGFMGCHGALNGLRVARAFATSEPESRVLVCAAELCSLHFTYGAGAHRSIPNALFADGAAAIVGAPVGEMTADSWTLAASGSVVVPETRDAMTWRIGDRGFAMTLSAEIPRLIRKNLRPWLETWISAQGLSLADIPSWIVHPGGPRILDAVQQALELEPSALAESREVLAEFGNMSSPTVLFILDRLIRRDAPRPCVTLGFGPGLVIEAALFV